MSNPEQNIWVKETTRSSCCTAIIYCVYYYATVTAIWKQTYLHAAFIHFSVYSLNGANLLIIIQQIHNESPPWGQMFKSCTALPQMHAELHGNYLQNYCECSCCTGAIIWGLTNVAENRSRCRKCIYCYTAVWSTSSTKPKNLSFSVSCSFPRAQDSSLSATLCPQISLSFPPSLPCFLSSSLALSLSLATHFSVGRQGPHSAQGPHGVCHLTNCCKTKISIHRHTNEQPHIPHTHTQLWLWCAWTHTHKITSKSHHTHTHTHMQFNGAPAIIHTFPRLNLSRFLFFLSWFTWIHEWFLEPRWLSEQSQSSLRTSTLRLFIASTVKCLNFTFLSVEVIVHLTGWTSIVGCH